MKPISLICDFYFIPIYYANVQNQWASLIKYVESRPCWFFPQEALQMFKHDFHSSATGNPLLVLNVTSTYD